MVDLDDVVVLWIGQVSDAPLEALICVLPNEGRIGRVSCHKVLLWIESFGILSDLILP